MKTVSTSFKIPQELERVMHHNLIEEGYGLKGKSRWVTEAIQSFLQLPTYADYVDIADEMRNLNTMVTIRMTDDLMKQVEASVIHIRKSYPALEGVKSKIFRASIFQRLLQNDSIAS